MWHHRLQGMILTTLACLAASPLAAQVERLPAVVSGERPSQVLAASYPAELPVETLAGSTSILPVEEPKRPVLFRPATVAWVARDGDGGLGLCDFEFEGILPVNIPSPDFPLLISPGFAVRCFDGPAAPDLPGEVYDAFAKFRWMRPVGERLGIDLGVTPGVYSDFHQSTDETFRVTGYGVAAWTATPTLKVVLGAAYIDRISTAVLPICGLVWTPHDDVKYELVFPNPRIARRIHLFDSPTAACECWVYVAGEFGGGIWAIERASGAADVVDYTDFRVLLGLSRELAGGLEGQVEVGYVFERELRYTSGSPGLEPGDTVMLRCGLTY